MIKNEGKILKLIDFLISITHSDRFSLYSIRNMSEHDDVIKIFFNINVIEKIYPLTGI